MDNVDSLLIVPCIDIELVYHTMSTIFHCPRPPRYLNLFVHIICMFTFFQPMYGETAWSRYIVATASIICFGRDIYDSMSMVNIRSATPSHSSTSNE